MIMKKKTTPLKDFVKRNKKKYSKKGLFQNSNSEFMMALSDNDKITSKVSKEKVKSNKKLDKDIKESIILEKQDASILNTVVKRPLEEIIIDLEKLNENKDRNYTTIEIILSIIEVVRNKDYYNLNSSEKSNQFWENAKEKMNVFSSFKSETLRKYWRPISQNIDKTLKMISSIRTVNGIEIIKYI